jgi:hypothetical protein
MQHAWHGGAAAACTCNHSPVLLLLTLLCSPLAPSQFADSIGLPTDEGLFGFKPFAEVWCGRLAMMGFVTSIVEEAMTGRGTLGQLGLPSGPNSATLGVLATATIAAVVVGSATTAYKLVAKKMTPK